MKIAIGEVFYHAYVDDEGTACCDPWVITAVQKGRASAVRKTEWTFDKNGRVQARISDWDRRSFRLEDGPPSGWAKSKAAAYGNALPEVEAAIKRLSRLAATIRGQQTRSRAKATARPADRKAKS